jgi:hypothetical protein
MKRKWMLGAGVILLVALGFAALLKMRQGEGSDVGFSSTRSIVLRDAFSGSEFRIGDPGEVRALVDAIDLKTKEPCECDHNLELIFETSTTPIRVSVCEHCFDVISPKPYRSCEMPGGFYALLEPLKKKLATMPVITQSRE